MTDTRLLGDYKVVKQIGQGPLGTVYLAEHRYMKNPYVIKVLPEELSTDRSFIQRFEEEITQLVALDHPHIVKIHNISFSQGTYFLVTDCIVDELGETTNLSQWLLGRNKLSDEEIYRLLTQLADALDYAHSKGKGIAHRGLKLNNILMGKGKGQTDLFVSDYGISRIVGTGAILTRTFKMVAEALGLGQSVLSQKYPVPQVDVQKLTPLHTSFLQNYYFLAPEQKLLEQQQIVDIKCDVYAFGVVAYYLLMGIFPEGSFPLPSERKTESSYFWDPLVTQCLRTDPAKRPENLKLVLENVMHAKAVKSFTQVSVHPVEVVKKVEEEELALQQVVRSGSSKLKPILNVALLERPVTDPDPAAIFQIDTTVKQYNPERKETSNIQPLLTDMVVIPGGAFYRGSNDGNRDEVPRHQVQLDSFAIDIHPVTNEQFVRFLEAMGGEKDNNHQDIIRMRDSRIKRSGGRLSIESGYAKHPVVGVTWYGAVAYARWLGKRLPTEAEWEIAARGGIENSLYPTGDEVEKSQANFFSSDTTAVMSYAPNQNELFDMAGNVYEWCYDWYGYNSYEASVQEPENPKGPLQGVYRVLRGGCWKSLKEDLRCSKRHRNNPGTVNGTYGFRCAADVEE